MGLKRFILGMLLEVRPPVAVPVFLAALFGGAMAGIRDWGLALLLALASLMALFVSHHKDSYTDFWIRREYELGYRSRFKDAGGVLRKEEFALAIGFFSGIFLALTAYLTWATTLLFLPFMLLAFTLALVYVPYLDKKWYEIFVWPLGVLCVILGGYIVQAGTLSLEPVLLGSLIWWFLSFGKILDSCPDAKSDLKLGKRTVPVILGVKRAKRISYAGLYSGVLLGAVLCLAGLIDSWLLGGLALAAPIVAYSQRFDPQKGIMVAIAAAYLILIIGILVYLS